MPAKRGSSGTRFDAAVLHALEKQHTRPKRKDPIRRIMGAVALGVWLLFMIGEFFHLVEHQETFGHDLTKWSPLLVGLLLLAPDAFERLVAFVGRLKGLKVSLPSKEEEESK